MQAASQAVHVSAAAHNCNPFYWRFNLGTKIDFVDKERSYQIDPCLKSEKRIYPRLYICAATHTAFHSSTEMEGMADIGLDVDNCASQGLAHGGRVAEAIGVSSSSLLAACAVTDRHSTAARCNVLTIGTLHLKAKLSQILNGLLSIQLAVIVLHKNYMSATCCGFAMQMSDK